MTVNADFVRFFTLFGAVIPDKVRIYYLNVSILCNKHKILSPQHTQTRFGIEDPGTGQQACSLVLQFEPKSLKKVSNQYYDGNPAIGRREGIKVGVFLLRFFDKSRGEIKHMLHE
ncbi:MAG: hypothetical protein LBN36_06085 [Clostridiales Family XIII bacterium]|nr:hypothetical protein [Clostridiales Family XIII bacterium]